MSDELSDILKLIHEVVTLMPKKAHSDGMDEIGKIIDSTVHGHAKAKLAKIQAIAREKVTAKNIANANPNSFFENSMDQRFYYALHKMDEANIIAVLERLKAELENVIGLFPQQLKK